MSETKKKRRPVPGSGPGKRRDGRVGKYTQKTVQKALTMIAEGITVREISRQLGIPTSTINTWKKASLDNDPEELKKLRLECASASARASFEAHEKAMKILHRELDRALTAEETLDGIIEQVKDMARAGAIDTDRARSLITDLERQKLNDAGKVAQVAEAMYKQGQLAAGGVTERVDGEITVVGFDDL